MRGHRVRGNEGPKHGRDRSVVRDQHMLLLDVGWQCCTELLALHDDLGVLGFEEDDVIVIGEAEGSWLAGQCHDLQQ